jgi:hypothetical protein
VGHGAGQRVRETLGKGGAFEIQVQTTDDGIMLRLPTLRDWLPISVIRDMDSAEAERRRARGSRARRRSSAHGFA